MLTEIQNEQPPETTSYPTYKVSYDEQQLRPPLELDQSDIRSPPMELPEMPLRPALVYPAMSEL